MKSKFILIVLLLVAGNNFISAQIYAEVGYEFGLLKQAELNKIVLQYNSRENHQLKDFNFINGYRVGFGKYNKYSNFELGFGNIFKKNTSLVPGQFRSKTELAVNFTSIDGSFSYKPFKNQFLGFGAAIHFGQLRYRYAFGGDYQVPVTRYSIGGEIFADLALKIKFLLKKDSRSDMFYILKLRPFYKVQPSNDITELQRSLNNDNSVATGDIIQKANYFGFRFSLVVPILSKRDREYYKKGGDLEKENLDEKMLKESLKSRGMKKSDIKKMDQPRW
jgi:hypothetical protein